MIQVLPFFSWWAYIMIYETFPGRPKPGQPHIIVGFPPIAALVAFQLRFVRGPAKRTLSEMSRHCPPGTAQRGRSPRATTPASWGWAPPWRTRRSRARGGEGGCSCSCSCGALASYRCTHVRNGTGFQSARQCNRISIKPRPRQSGGLAWKWPSHFHQFSPTTSAPFWKSLKVLSRNCWVQYFPPSFSIFFFNLFIFNGSFSRQRSQNFLPFCEGIKGRPQ